MQWSPGKRKAFIDQCARDHVRHVSHTLTLIKTKQIYGTAAAQNRK